MRLIKNANRTKFFFTIGGIGLLLFFILTIHSHSLKTKIHNQKENIAVVQSAIHRLGDSIRKRTHADHVFSEAEPVSKSYVISMSELRKAAVFDGISLGQVMLASSGGSNIVSNIGIRLKGIGKPSKRYLGLRVIKVHIDGSWSDYSGLERWVRTMSTLPVALRKIDVGEKNFDMELYVYGT